MTCQNSAEAPLLRSFFEKIRKMGGIYVKKDGKVKNSMIT